MNIKTNSHHKRIASKTGLRTHSQVNIHKSTRLYSLEFEAYDKKYLFKEHHTNNVNDNNCIHFKDFIRASTRKEMKTNQFSHNGSSITAKTTKVFSGNNSPRNQSIGDCSNSEVKFNRNESNYFTKEVYETCNYKAKSMSMNSSGVFSTKTSQQKRHKARSVTRLSNNDNNVNTVNRSFINVYCRIRPLNTLERMHTNNTLCVNIVSETQLEIINNNNIADLLTQYYSFDAIFPPSTAKDEIYNKTSKSIIDSVLQGYNGTIMAYGQTSSGKTFTIQGETVFPNGAGVIPRAMRHVFNRVSQDKDTFVTTASFLEIYMERINDLFDPSRSNLHIQDDAQRKPHIINLSTITLSSYEAFMKAYKKAAKNRTTSLTAMNDYSSRSHSMMIVNIINKTKALHGKLFIVDLAGSEKISKTNCQGLNIEEAKLINKSLSQLGLIIKALTTNTSHIPYRSSKLTRLLAESLGGNSRTSLILTCSPSLYNINETLSTLRFGKRAKMIRNIRFP